MTERGFTLLEVMIAVAILGLSLTAIFSSEVGAANVAARARRQNVAVTLARCKMGEIEQTIAIEGLPALDKKDTDNCCEHAPVKGFECEWIVDRIILPELGAQDDEDGDEAEDAKDSPTDLLAEATDEIESQGITSQEVIAGQGGNLAMLALQLGFPILKPFLEEQVRRATVSVRWKEGSKERGFDVIQFLVSDQPAPSDDSETEGEE
ncbi:MAG: prepilin-type N-terminal cleavage/methylation domain-containing protein [Deltaproteobacteria bacterium]|nr:prepilin-type N-terminal cleavage/methylation domain-containing protein [Deltaproteobacteria bacterium]